jgi:hypothetical protein
MIHDEVFITEANKYSGFGRITSELLIAWREFMRKKPEYGFGRNVVANKPSARRPLAAVMMRER